VPEHVVRPGGDRGVARSLVKTGRNRVRSHEAGEEAGHPGRAPVGRTEEAARAVVSVLARLVEPVVIRPGDEDRRIDRAHRDRRLVPWCLLSGEAAIDGDATDGTLDRRVAAARVDLDVRAGPHRRSEAHT